MTPRLLTEAEKDAIRNSPCGKCGAVPPFADGSRCHPHRVISESKGGQYTKRNTVPRCAKCHSKEPGHSPGLILLPPSKIRASLRGRALTPEHRAKISAAKQGKHLSPDHRARISSSKMGHEVSAVTRKKIAAALRERSLKLRRST